MFARRARVARCVDGRTDWSSIRESWGGSKHDATGSNHHLPDGMSPKAHAGPRRSSPTSMIRQMSGAGSTGFVVVSRSFSGFTAGRRLKSSKRYPWLAGTLTTVANWNESIERPGFSGPGARWKTRCSRPLPNSCLHSLGATALIVMGSQVPARHRSACWNG